MQRGTLKLLLLTWCSAVVMSAPSDSSNHLSLGDRVIKKHAECEHIISDSLDDILSDEDTDPFDEIRIPELDNYHNCKEELDELKREYMKQNNIVGNTKLITIKTKDEEIQISAPPEVGAEVNELEFDVIDELCVTHRKCEDILNTILKDRTNSRTFYGRFTNCNIVLDRVKASYIEEEQLDKFKLIADGGMTVMCTGKKVLMDLPSFANNLDFHKPLHEIAQTKGEEKATPGCDVCGTPATPEEHAKTTPTSTATPDHHDLTKFQHVDHSELTDHSEHAFHGHNTPIEAIKSSALTERGDLLFCSFVMVVLYFVMNRITGS